jgi:hypothetical protein
MDQEAVVVGHAGVAHAKRGLLAIADRAVPFVATLKRWIGRQDGQSFGEYSLILTLVVVIAAAGLSPLGAALGTLITNTVAAVVAML